MTSYVQEMRQHVGHAPLLLVAVGLILHDGQRVLLQRRADNGKWAIHGGSLEPIDREILRDLAERLAGGN